MYICTCWFPVLTLFKTNSLQIIEGKIFAFFHTNLLCYHCCKLVLKMTKNFKINTIYPIKGKCVKFFSNAHITVFQGAVVEFVRLCSYILKDWQTCPAAGQE